MTVKFLPPTYHRTSIKSHGTLMAEQRERISRMTQADQKKMRDAEMFARQAEEARQRTIGYRTASRPDSVALVKYTYGRGMSKKRMYEIWGRVFVDTILGKGAQTSELIERE